LIIATWNVNSIKARFPVLCKWINEVNPDILLLQETKTVDNTFPKLELEELGYNLAIHGQKSYNGVAILSKFPIEDIVCGLPDNNDDEQARYIECFTGGVRVASIYAPNGNPSNSPKFTYKLKWMDRLLLHAKNLLHNEEVVVLGGDYNVIPSDGDVYDPSSWHDDALFKTETRSSFQAIINLGYTEAFRALNKQTGMYTFWDYQKGRFQRDEGLRIDHFLLSPEAADLLNTCTIDRKPRSWTKTSDHTPVLCELR
tara:strand:- start:703 stop:1470 length:768 start_codon:yes stop_codon:yes gene_type:complete